MDRGKLAGHPRCMTVLSRELDIPLPSDLVWEQLIDLDRWPAWMAHVISAGWEEGSEAGPEGRLFLHYQHNEAAPQVQAQVTSWRPGKELAWQAVGGDTPFTEGMKGVEWGWRLFGRSSGFTTVRFTLSYQARGGLPFFRELVGTRLQVLNMADTSLQSLRAMATGTVPMGEIAEA